MFISYLCGDNFPAALIQQPHQCRNPMNEGGVRRRPRDEPAAKSNEGGDEGLVATLRIENDSGSQALHHLRKDE